MENVPVKGNMRIVDDANITNDDVREFEAEILVDGQVTECEIALALVNDSSRITREYVIKLDRDEMKLMVLLASHQLAYAVSGETRK